VGLDEFVAAICDERDTRALTGHWAAAAST
jgi:hypothetical protein